MNVDKLINMMMENPEIIPMCIPELSIGEELHKILKDYANNTEFFKIHAKIKKQIFDAYIDAGFNEDQAIAFMINDNIKLMQNIKKQTSNLNNKR